MKIYSTIVGKIYIIFQNMRHVQIAVLLHLRIGVFDQKHEYPLKSIMREWRNWQTRWT